MGCAVDDVAQLRVQTAVIVLLLLDEVLNLVVMCRCLVVWVMPIQVDTCLWFLAPVRLLVLAQSLSRLQMLGLLELVGRWCLVLGRHQVGHRDLCPLVLATLSAVRVVQSQLLLGMVM